MCLYLISISCNDDDQCIYILIVLAKSPKLFIRIGPLSSSPIIRNDFYIGDVSDRYHHHHHRDR